MTPRQKAEKLLSKFGDIEHLGVYGEYNGSWNWSSSLWNEQTKEAALIAVDEILDLDLHDVGDYRNDQSSSDDFSTVTWYINYWEEVKQEIEKL